MLALFRAQPPAFHMIFMIEVWERFGYYTVQGILTLYFIRFLGFSHSEAYFTFGAFSALVYGMVAVGGYLGDKVLGTKRTIVLGLCTLIAGYLALALADKKQIFLALGLVCVGNGLFKANPSNLLAKCYEKNDKRLHSGFTLYYMAINLGSIFALFMGPFIVTHWGYFYAYFLSVIGLVLGLTNYYFQRQSIAHICTAADCRKISFMQGLFIAAGIGITTLVCAYLLQQVLIAKTLLCIVTAIIVAIYLNYMRKESKENVKRMVVALILMLQAVVFFTLYQQMPTSLNLFAIDNVSPYLLGIRLDPQSFQALNPIWIILMSPFLSWIYKKQQEQGIFLSIPYKFTTGMFFCGLSFSLLYGAKFFHDAQGIVSPGWLIASYFFQSLGELLVSALGVAMVAELIPKQITGFVMGMWFLTSALASFLGASVASLTSLPKNSPAGLESLNLYTNTFACIGLITLSIALLMWISAPYLNRYMPHKKT